MTKDVDKKLIELLKGKTIIFLEGDMGLYHTVGVLEKFLIENKIPYHTALNIGEMSLEGVKELVDYHDVIIWESQYVSDTAENIMGLLFDDEKTTWLAQGNYVPKILLECYISEPLYYYKPDGTKKRYLGFTTSVFDKNDIENWELYEFGDDKKPYWEKEENEL